MKYFILIILSAISLNSFANIQSYYPTNTNRIEVSGYINANKNAEVYLKESPSFFFIHKNVFYSEVDKTLNDFSLTVLDSSKLDNGILFLNLSHLQQVNIDFINIKENQTKEIHIQLSDVYNNPNSENSDDFYKEPLTLNIKGLKSQKLFVKSDRNLSINLNQTKIDYSLIEVPENVILNNENSIDSFKLIKRGWLYKG